MSPQTIASRLLGRLRRQPAPRALVAAYLSMRWGCLVSPRAKIIYPDRVRIGRGARIGECQLIASGDGIEIGEGSELHDGALLDAQRGRIRMGRNSGIGPYSIVYGLAGVDIGDYCAIAGHTMIVAGNHHFSRTDLPIRQQGSSGKGIHVGSDIWIGSHCVILDGARVGNGSVVAAGSVVRGEVEEYSIVGGTPARLLKKRVREG